MTKQKTTVVSKFSRSFVTSCIPQGWSLVPVGNLLKGTEYGVSEPGDAQGDTPIVGMKNIGDGKVLLSNLSTINSDGADLSKMTLRKGDILLNRTNSPDLVGKVGIVRENSDAVFASYLVRLTVDPERMDAEYLNAWLNGDIAQRAIKRISTRAVSQANVNPTEFQKYCPVLFPEVEGEQTKIAAVLRTWDEAIGNLLRLSELRKKQYLGLRDHLIDWSKHQRSAKEFLKPVSRPVSKPTSGYRALSIRSHGKGTFDRYVENPESIEMDTLYVVKSGDIIVNITFAWEGAVALVPRDHDGCLVSHRFPTFVPKMERVDARYLRHALRMARFTYLLGIVSPGGAGRNRVLSKSDFLDLMVPLPPLDQQQRIAMILDDAEDAISVEEKYLSALKHQKRGLMQKLLTGEWRVKC